MFKELKATAIIVLIIVCFILLFSLINTIKFPNLFIVIFISYIILAIIVNSIASSFKNKYIDFITTTLWFPLGIIYAFMTVLIPFVTLLANVFFYFVVSFSIPLIIFETLSFFRIIDFLNLTTIIYLKITLTVLISVLLNPLLKDIVYRYSPICFLKSKKLRPYELDNLSDYLLSIDNIRFLVYGGYVIALLTTNYLNFQGESITNNIELDKSVLQSFVTFIAFDRSFALMKNLNFRPSRLLDKIRNSISNKIKSNIYGKT